MPRLTIYVFASLPPTLVALLAVSCYPVAAKLAEDGVAVVIFTEASEGEEKPEKIWRMMVTWLKRPGTLDPVYQVLQLSS
jgi:hypothetical protein